MLACSSKVTGVLSSPRLEKGRSHLAPPSPSEASCCKNRSLLCGFQRTICIQGNSERRGIPLKPAWSASGHPRHAMIAKDLDRARSHLRVTKTKLHAHESQVQSLWGFGTIHLGYSRGFQSQSALPMYTAKTVF